MRRFFLPLLLLSFACNFAPAPGVASSALEADEITVTGPAVFLGDSQFGTDYSDTLVVGASWANDLLFQGSGFPYTIGILTPPAGNNGGVLTVRSAAGANADATHSAGIGGDFILGGALGGSGDGAHAPAAGARTIVRGGAAGALGAFEGEAFGGDVTIDAGVGVGRTLHDGFTGIDGAIKIGTLTGRIVLLGRQAAVVDTNGFMFQAHGPAQFHSEDESGPGINSGLQRGPSFWTVKGGALRLEPDAELRLYGTAAEFPIQEAAPAVPPTGFFRFYATEDGEGEVHFFLKLHDGTAKEIAFVN